MRDSTHTLAVAALVLLAGAALPAAAQAPHGPGGRWMHGGDPMQAAIAQLALTPEQQGKVKAIADDETPKIAALRDQIAPARSVLDAAAHAATPDPTTVGAAYLKVVAAEDAVKVEAAKYHDAVAAVLTPEQKAQFESHLAAARDARGRWSGPHGGVPQTN